MHRAGRRARERAEQVARNALKTRSNARLDGLYGTIRSLWSFLRRF